MAVFTALLSGSWIEGMPGAGLDWYSLGYCARRVYELSYAMRGRVGQTGTAALQERDLPRGAGGFDDCPDSI